MTLVILLIISTNILSFSLSSDLSDPDTSEKNKLSNDIKSRTPGHGEQNLISEVSTSTFIPVHPPKYYDYSKISAKNSFKNIKLSKTAEDDNTENVCEIDEEIRKIRYFDDIVKLVHRRGLRDRINPSLYDVKTLKDNIVTYHNIYRSKHDAPALIVDPYLEYRGERYADILANVKGCLIHEQPRVYGENLVFFGSHYLPNPKTLAQAVVESFYVESSGYDYTIWKPYSYHKSGHFTQLVWKTSRRIGVGVSIITSDMIDPDRYIPYDVDRSLCAKSDSKYMYLIFVVVKYDPPGNMDYRNEYLYNVQPPIVSF